MCDDANKGPCQCTDKTQTGTEKGQCCQGGTCSHDSAPAVEPAVAPAEAPTQE